MNQPKVQVSCVLKDDNRVLMIRRVKKMAHTYMQLIPAGGHVELGESLREAVVREMAEETGVQMIEPQLIGVITFISDVDGSHNVCFMYWSEAYTGNVETREPDKVVPEWTKRDELTTNEDIPFYYREFFEQYERNDNKFVNCTVKFLENGEINVLFN